MFIYLLSIVFFVFVLLKGVGKEGIFDKTLIVSAVIVAGYNLYRIFLGEISNSFIVNLLLCVVPGIVFFVGLVLVFASKTETSEKKSSKNISNQNKAFYKENIVDNETTKSNYKTSDNGTHIDPDNDAPLVYKDSKIDGFGSCDVEETSEFIKITMKNEGKEYEFYVKGQNIVAYRFEGMSSPQSY